MKLKLLPLLLIPALLSAETANRRLNDAASILSELQGAKDKGIPMRLLAQAQCIIVVPGVKQAAFIGGAKYGKGFFSCRRGADWTAPAAVRIEGGSFGFQIGIIESDLVLLVKNRKGANRLLSSQFTLGGNIEAAGGPVGRSSTATTDATFRAEILSYSRARGAFAGVSLQGATLRQDTDDNAQMYGRPLTNKQIIHGAVAWPQEGDELHSVLQRFSARAERRRKE